MRGKLKLKNKILAVILMILFAILGSNTLAEGEGESGTVEKKIETLWFDTPSEASKSTTVVEGGSYKEAWYPVDNENKNDEDILQSAGAIYGINSLVAKRGENFFLLEVLPESKGKRMLYVKLNSRTYNGDKYKINFDYFNGKKDSTSNTRLDFTTDVYLVADLTVKPEEEEVEKNTKTEENTGEEIIENKKIQLLGTLEETKDSNSWISKEFEFTSEVDSAENAFLLFVPKATTSYNKAYLALEQGENDVIEKNITVKDLGVKFLGTKYNNTYGIGNNVLVDSEEKSL